MTGNKLLESEYNSHEEDTEDADDDDDDDDDDEIKNGIRSSGNNILTMNKSNDIIDEHKLSAEL